jgi:hypothetical protein
MVNRHYRTKATLSENQNQSYGKAVQEGKGEFVQVAQRREGGGDGRVRRKAKWETRKLSRVVSRFPFFASHFS